jgi:hypothetical protein
MTGTLSSASTSDRWFTVLDGARLRELRHQHGLLGLHVARGIGAAHVTRGPDGRAGRRVRAEVGRARA